MNYFLLNLVAIVIFVIIKILDWVIAPFTVLKDIYYIKKLIRQFPLEVINPEALQDQTYETDIIYSLVGDETDKNEFPSSLIRYLSPLVKVESGSAAVNITQLYGSIHGKSSPAPNLDVFSQSRLQVIKPEERMHYARPISFITLEDFNYNIEVLERRLRHEDIYLYEFKWNKRIFLSTYDKAHTIAAIYRQAKAQGLSYKVKGCLKSYEINSDALEAFKEAWLCFIVEKRSGIAADLQDFISHLKGRAEAHIYIPGYYHSKCLYLFIKKGGFWSKLLAQEFKLLEEHHKVVDLYNLLSSYSESSTLQKEI